MYLPPGHITYVRRRERRIYSRAVRRYDSDQWESFPARAARRGRGRIRGEHVMAQSIVGNISIIDNIHT